MLLPHMTAGLAEDTIMRWTSVVFASLLLFVPCMVVAQQADVLTGRVTGTDGKPISGARVEAISIETEISRSVVTDANGRYLIVFPDGGGRYLLRVSFIGMADVVRTVMREAEEELLLTHIVLTEQPIELEGITVRAQLPPPGRGQTAEQSTDLPQTLLNRLPLPDLDPNTLALLSAGVVSTSLDSLSGRMGFSVAGMSDLLNQIMLDGVILGEGGLAVPEEGVRRTQVTTGTFDVSRGGFAGGQVAMTTARGANRASGSLSYRLDDDALQLRSTPTTNAFTRHNIGGAWGGPLLPNRLFYHTSFQLGRNVNHRYALAADDPLASQRSGVHVDSIARFLSILRDRHGITALGQSGRYRQISDDIRLQGRLDWNLLQRQGQSQTLLARFNLSLNDQDSTRISALDVAHHGGEMERNNRLAAVTLTSRFGGRWINSFSLSYGESWSDALPYIQLPEGVVRVVSDFEDGTRNSSRLVFGGNRSMPTEARSRDFQISDDLSFLLPVGFQLHRLKVGGSLQRSHNVNRSTDNLFGTFTFASLADFEANLPERYDRTLTERQTRTGTFNAGLYVGDTWRVSVPLEITMGLRWDYSRLDQRAEYNPAVEAAFGRRTDIEPAAAGFSPRIGFNYRLSRQGERPKALNGGIGVFSGRAPTGIFSAAMRQTGLPDAEQRLSCIGSVVPIPDWDRYLEDPSALPTLCADAGPGVPPVLSSRAPNVTVIDPGQNLPSSLRFDVGYMAWLPFNLNANIRYNFSRGYGLWGYRDINLDESKTFILAGEGRPFFGDPESIVPETGAVSSVASRLHPEFGNVFDVTSSLGSTSHQLVAQLSGILPPKATFSVNYTLGFARDQGSGSFASATTAGNPNEPEWAVSGNDRRHTLNVWLSYAITPEIEVTAMGRLSSGSPFTPMVNRDINGDGVRNDRAFVFDPRATADTAIAGAMTRLLAVVPGRIRDCLESQFGSIAARNSCRNAWTQSLDMRASLRPVLPGLGRRLTLSLDARNVLTGLDQLINGKNNMKGWGEGQWADPNLLEVRGFDPATNAFRYQVNEGFGQTRRGPNAFRNAFSITLSGRVTIGGQPFMTNRGFGPIAAGGGYAGAIAAMGGGGMRVRGVSGGLDELGALFRPGATAGPVDVDSVLARVLANPVDSVIALRDSLGLSAEQLAIVRAISDTLRMQLDRRRAALSTALQHLVPAAGQQGGRRERAQGAQLAQQLQLEVQPHLDGARREMVEALRLTERALTPEQWQKVPTRIRYASQGGMRGPGGFNAVGFLDRLLANPIPVLLEFRDTLKMTPEQLTRIQAISDTLQQKLNKRREELGKRFDNVPPEQQGRIFQQMQPEIQASRREISEALGAVEKILTKEQWQKLPQRVRSPFGAGPGRGGRGT